MQRKQGKWETSLQIRKEKESWQASKTEKKKKEKKWKTRLMLLSLLAVLGTGQVTGKVEAAGQVEADILVECSSDGYYGPFTFSIQTEEAEPNGQEIETRDISLSAGEKGAFEIKYVLPGTYHYSIRQETGTEPGVIYDDAVFHAVTYVTEEDDGSMKAKVIVSKNEEPEKVDGCLFENKIEKKETEKQPQEGPKSALQKILEQVKTGDENHVLVWIGICIISLVIIIEWIAFRKEKKKK